MSDESLAVVRKAVASVSGGKAVNEDAWMAQWCTTNWGDLLQPAPLSISLLGSILIIASATDDFSLVNDAPEGCPPFDWKYARRPDSFKTCLQQMVGDGYTAFGTAHKDMETIMNTTSQIPDVIRDIVNIVLQGSAEDIGSLFQNSIDDLQQLSRKARNAALESDEAFRDIAGLAQEMVLACTYKSGTAEQALNQNAIQLEVLRVQKEHEDAMLKDAKETAAMMKKSYTSAEEEFHNAVHDVPSGWDLMGMQVVESLTNLVVSAGNAAISHATMTSQAAKAGIGAFSGMTGGGDKSSAPAAEPAAPVPSTSPSGVSTQPNSGALSDPGTMLVQRVLDQANIIKTLLTGNKGKPDWDKIGAKNASDKSGGSYVQATLKSQKSQLAKGKPISEQLGPFIDTALGIIATIIKAAGNVNSSGNDDSLKSQVTPTTELVTELQSLFASVNLILQQPGAAANGPATPVAPATAATGAAQLAVQNAKMKVDQTRSQLEASRASFEKASDRLCEQQQEITKTIGNMTQLSLTNASLRQLLPVLKQAVGAFTTLRAQFSQLVQFFDSVASLLVDIMGPSIDRWVRTLTSAEEQRMRGEEEPSVAGVTVSAFTRDLIYRQMMTPLKVSTLATHIAHTYLGVSNEYILPAQRTVGSMLQFADSDSASDRAALNARLSKSQGLLAKEAQRASSEISSKVAADQKKFTAKITLRLDTIVKETKLALPSVAKPLPTNLRAVADAHVNDFDATKAIQAAENPMFDADDAM